MSEFFFRKRNQNKDFTLIARDCVGGILYHQLGLKFLSPTINLFFTPEDFNYFCLNLKEYIDTELVETKEEWVDYPLGELSPIGLKSIKVHFMHYETFKLAKEKWDERKARINYDNLYIFSSFCYPKETATLSKDLISKWNQIKYKKVMIVDKNYGFDDEYIIKKPEECTEYAWLLYTPDQKNEWKRTFNEFDFIKFLNEK